MNRLLLIFFLLLITSCGISKAPSQFFSKEMCSCLFVERQSEDYCRNYLNISLPIWGDTINTKDKTVASQGYFRSSVAKFKNPMLGCQIVP